MPAKLQIKSYNHLRATTPRIADAVDDITNGFGTVASQLAMDPNGADNLPASVALMSAQNLMGHVDFALTDNSKISRAINYFVEIDVAPGFVNPIVVPLGPSRNGTKLLPNGTYYLRPNSQYVTGGPPSAYGPTFGPLVISNSVIGNGTLLPSQGSGTGGGGAGKTITRA